MDNTFKTSFIPKKPIIPDENNKRKEYKSISIFPALATILLVLTIATSIGLFVYKNYLNKQKENLSASLLEIRDTFEEGTIRKLELFQDKVNSAKEVLDSHIVLSPLFNLLGEITIPSIQYTKFDHETKDDGFYVKISGISRDYRSIALQADAFNQEKGRYFKNVVFSNLTKDKNNNITFNLDFTVLPSLLSYKIDVAKKVIGGDSNPLLDNSNIN